MESGECLTAEDCSYRGECVEGACSCQEGFSGDHCDTADDTYWPACMMDRFNGEDEEDLCSGAGFCTDSGCECKEGFSGDSCETAAFACLTHETPCNRVGVCDPQSGCVCLDGLSGDSCETGLASCWPQTSDEFQEDLLISNCSGNGRCHPTNGCLCFEGFEGADCATESTQTPLCQDLADYCLNGGTCEASGCDCTSTGFTGPRCGQPEHGCASDASFCGANGACTESEDTMTFFCECNSHFYGDTC